MKLETEVFKRLHKSSQYDVEYHLFRQRSKTLGPIIIPDLKEEKDVITLKYVCFSGLLGTFSKNLKKINRICYKPKINKILKTSDVKDWIDISKAGKLLPPYIEYEHLKKIFLLRCNIPPSLLYVYLCTLRDLQEEPDFVRITSYLVKNGMDIHAAIVAASSISINNSGHHYLSLYAPYSERPITSVKVSLSNIFQLKEFLDNPSTYDKRNCVLLGSSYAVFSAQNAIHGISLPSLKDKDIPILDLFDENIANMLSLGTYDQEQYDKYITSKNVTQKDKA